MLYKFLRFVSLIVFFFLFHLKIKGRGNTKNIKGAILAVNHTSFIDPLFAGVAYPYPLYYLARSSLFQNKLFAALLYRIHAIPVNRNTLNIRTFRRIIELLHNGQTLLVFPEGTRSIDGRLLPAESGIGLIALKAKAPIIPMYIKGAYKVMPRYRNFITLYKITVSIGQPVYLDTWFNKEHIGKADYKAVSDLVMSKIRSLA